jgi:sugar (pentulose or hexulose) kinase
MTTAAVCARGGHDVARARAPTRVARPQPSWVEIDPDHVWRAATAVCRAVMAEARITGTDIAAVGITGVMVGAWVVDVHGTALRPGILWEDGRSLPWIEHEETERPGFLSRIFQQSGSAMQQGCTLPVLRWLADHEPDVLARAAAVYGSKDYVRQKLTGVMATDRTEAAVAPGSARARDRSPELIDAFGLKPWAHLLPRVHDSETVAGQITAAAAAATGLAEGTPVAIGAGDVPASVLGAGGGAPGLAITILGTTCLNGVVVDAPLFEPADLGLLFTLPGDLWLRTMVNVAGTINLDWFLSTFCAEWATAPDAFARLEALAQDSPLGAQGLTYLPYLSDAGIIAPVVEPGARAVFAGLSLSHTRADLARAVYEGLLLSVRDCFVATALPVSRIRLVGGGSRSNFLVQMLADITGIPVDVPLGSEFGAKGAALIAATAVGWFPNVREAAQATYAAGRSFIPDAATTAEFQPVFDRYRAQRDAALAAVAAAKHRKGASS